MSFDIRAHLVMAKPPRLGAVMPVPVVEMSLADVDHHFAAIRDTEQDGFEDILDIFLQKTVEADGEYTSSDDEEQDNDNDDDYDDDDEDFVE